MIDYDRLYDITPADLRAYFNNPDCNCALCKLMREGGLEPPSLSAPDPKTRATLPGWSLWCPKCQSDREESEFSWTDKRRSSYCRECQSAIHAAWRKTRNGKASEGACAVRARERHPHKVKARNALYHEIRKGRMVKGACESHGADCRGRVEAHHDDYARPLDVRWICQHHHRVADETRRERENHTISAQRHAAPRADARTTTKTTTCVERVRRHAFNHHWTEFWRDGSALKIERGVTPPCVLASLPDSPPGAPSSARGETPLENAND